jgi:hypothetical protein
MVVPAIFIFESINDSYQTWKELCLVLDQDDQRSDRPLEAGPAPSETDLQWLDLAATDWIGVIDGRRVAGGGRRRADGLPKMGRPATKSGWQLAESGREAAESRMQRSGATNFAHNNSDLILI